MVAKALDPAQAPMREKEMSAMGPGTQFSAELGRRLLCSKLPRSVEE